jgi:mannose-6-phosphate isomerase-like protein (cupin superfamily)
MSEFPEFMRNPVNKISSASQYTKNIEGYVFDGTDGSQMCIWTYPTGGLSAEHVHEYDEYMVVIEGLYTVIIDGRRIPVGPGQEHVVTKDVLHSGEVAAGTRAIYAFGGRRAQRIGEA